MQRIMRNTLILLLSMIICVTLQSKNTYGISDDPSKKYSEREMIILKTIGAEIEDEYKMATAISVEKIVSNTLSFKFDTPPIIYDDRTLIPVRAVTESLGASVGWYPKEKKVSIIKDSITINLYIDNNKVTVNDKEKKIDVPAKLLNSRTYVPLRFVVEEFGLDIQYDSKTGVITLGN